MIDHTIPITTSRFSLKFFKEIVYKQLHHYLSIGLAPNYFNNFQHAFKLRTSQVSQVLWHWPFKDYKRFFCFSVSSGLCTRTMQMLKCRTRWRRRRRPTSAAEITSFPVHCRDISCWLGIGFPPFQVLNRANQVWYSSPHLTLSKKASRRISQNV